MSAILDLRVPSVIFEAQAAVSVVGLKFMVKTMITKLVVSGNVIVMWQGTSCISRDVRLAKLLGQPITQAYQGLVSVSKSYHSQI